MSEAVPLDVRKADKKLWLIKACLFLHLQGALLPWASLLSVSAWHRCPSTWRSTGKLQHKAPPAKHRALDQSWAACALPAAVPRCFCSQPLPKQHSPAVPPSLPGCAHNRHF